MRRAYQLHLGWVLMLTVSGCAGYRGGWESAAYVGNLRAAPSAAAGRAPASREHRPLTLPGLELEVSLDNRLRIYDVQVYLYVLPLWIDPRPVYANNAAPGKTRVYITVTPSTPDFVFRPELASLTVADQRFVAIAGFEFNRWDRDGKRIGRINGVVDVRSILGRCPAMTHRLAKNPSASVYGRALRFRAFQETESAECNDDGRNRRTEK